MNKEYQNQIVVGEINSEIAEITGIETGTIVLCDGNDMWGRIHITKKHINDLLSNGYTDVDTFVNDVVTNFNQLRLGKDKTIMLVKWNGLPKVVFIALNFNIQTNCYTVGSAGLFRKDYIEKRKLLWERSAPFR